MVQTNWLDNIIKRLKQHKAKSIEAWEGLTEDEAYHIKMCHDSIDPSIAINKKVYPKLSRQQRIMMDMFMSAPNHEVANYQFVDAKLHRFGARVNELRNKGYSIWTGDKQKNGVVWYRLEGIE